jgi:hypothetical protein
LAESAGQEETVDDADLEAAMISFNEPEDKLCCVYGTLSLQEDFMTEKPMIQHFLEGQGQVCLFLPKFHCKINPIEMAWGYGKYHVYLAFYLASHGRVPCGLHRLSKND